MMLLVLTIERYVSVCHPGYNRPVMGNPRVTVVVIPILTFILYLPSVFRGQIVECVWDSEGPSVYYRRDNTEFQETLFYGVSSKISQNHHLLNRFPFQVYKIILEVIFKLIPTILIAGLNIKIMLAYRRTCQKRRGMIISRNTCCKEDDPRKFAEERRLFLLLGNCIEIERKN